VTTRWLLTEEAAADLERLTDFLPPGRPKAKSTPSGGSGAEGRAWGLLLLASAPEAALETVDIILNGLHILGNHPLMGRPLAHGLRELVISRGRTGYLALYRYDARADVALVLAVKHQRESDYH